MKKFGSYLAKPLIYLAARKRLLSILSTVTGAALGWLIFDAVDSYIHADTVLRAILVFLLTFLIVFVTWVVSWLQGVNAGMDFALRVLTQAADEMGAE